MTGVLGSITPGPIGWVIKLLSSGKALIAAGWEWATESTTHLLIVALVAVGVHDFITHRIAAHTITKLRNQITADANLIADMNRKAEAARLQGIQRAKENDSDHQAIQSGTRALTARYIASHRLSQQTTPSGTPAAPDAPGVPASTPTEALMVAVTPSDVNACADSYAYALSAYRLGKQMVDDGRAVYAKLPIGPLPTPDMGNPPDK